MSESDTCGDLVSTDEIRDFKVQTAARSYFSIVGVCVEC